MAINNGNLKEDEFVYYMNVKKASELNENLRSMMERLFGIVDIEKKVSCERTTGYIKPDIIIKHKRITKRLSIKSGTAHVFHNESIKPFILFLRSIGVSNRTQQTILLFQYGDGTMDGSGQTRLNGPDTCKWLKERIKEANTELNTNVDLIKKFIDRTMFDGVDPEAPKADAIFHGDVFKGVTVTKQQMHKYIEAKEWDKRDTLHIGPLHLVPAARYVDKEKKNMKKRHIIECYWPRISEDFEYISKRYTYYVSPHLSKKE